jgi:hypothetical protein
MAAEPHVDALGDSIAKVDDEVAVGENLGFQRRWWRFERWVWGLFLLVILCDLVGLFGHGWFSKAKASVPDKSLTVEYERVERANTPSAMTLHFGPGAIRNDQVKVYVSDSVVEDLGAQRIAPQPASSTVGAGGVTYVFPATPAATAAAVRIQLQPALPGLRRFQVQIPGAPPIEARVLVMP